MIDENKQWSKEFNKCPCCGSESRFFEGIVKELKQRGIADKDFNFFLDLKTGPVASPQMINKLPIGGEIPGFAFATDICTDCGTIYAVRLDKITVKKGLAPVQFIPNRQQRRAGMQGGQGFQFPPSMNNPCVS